MQSSERTGQANACKSADRRATFRKECYERPFEFSSECVLHAISPTVRNPFVFGQCPPFGGIYGPAVRRKKVLSIWRSWSCIKDADAVTALKGGYHLAFLLGAVAATMASALAGVYVRTRTVEATREYAME
jgi:hypothetical protein